MFGYVNLLVNELLMMKLHALVICIWILDELCSIDDLCYVVVDCGWIHDYELWLLMIVVVNVIL